MVTSVDRYGRSIAEWTEEDYRDEGMFTRKAIASNGHPLLSPCRLVPHSWDLEQEEGILYLYCTRCEATLVLSPHDTYRKRIHEEATYYSYRV